MVNNVEQTEVPGDRHAQNTSDSRLAITLRILGFGNFFHLRSRSSLNAFGSAVRSKTLLFRTFAEEDSDEHRNSSIDATEDHIGHFPTHSGNDKRGNNAQDNGGEVRARGDKAHAHAALVRGKPAGNDLRKNGHKQTSSTATGNGPGHDCRDKTQGCQKAEQDGTYSSQGACSNDCFARAELIGSHAPCERKTRIKHHVDGGDQANFGVVDAQGLTNGFQGQSRKTLSAQNNKLRQKAAQADDECVMQTSAFLRGGVFNGLKHRELLLKRLI